MSTTAQPDVTNFLNEVSSRFSATISLAAGRPTEQFFDRLHPGVLFDALSGYEQHALRSANAVTVPPMAALGEAGCVIYLSTFSKTLSPAFRVGAAVRPDTLFGERAARNALWENLVQRKNDVTVNTSARAQAVTDCATRYGVIVMPMSFFALDAMRRKFRPGAGATVRWGKR